MPVGAMPVGTTQTGKSTLHADGMEDVLCGCTTRNTPLFGLFGLQAPCRLVECHDGDTVKVAVLILGVPAIVTCRVEGIDCPEITPPKEMEGREECIAAATKARNQAIRWMSGLELDPQKKYSDKSVGRLLEACRKVVYARFLRSDKYGRTLARFYETEDDMRMGERCLSEHMVATGHARPYGGGTRGRTTV